MTEPGLPPAAPVLDAEQLVRIEAMHRGLLYQHMYVAACLLLAQRSGVREILVERDEDVELRSENAHVYIQVKTRGAPLMPSDIAGALERFDALRLSHASVADLASTTVDTPRAYDEAPDSTDASAAVRPGPIRRGTATFAVVANVRPGPTLAERIASPEWPRDVLVVWPGCTMSRPNGVPPAWPTVADALSWCTEHAAGVPFARIAPATLVWKLAALAQATAMGGVSAAAEAHVFRAEQLPELFEQIVRALHEAPEPPEPYWAQENEPLPDTGASVRFVVGPSGSGKSAWAATHAMHSVHPTAYFAAPASGGAPFAAALAQELAARFMSKAPEDLATVLMPGASGLDALRALSAALGDRGVHPVLVLDDAHRISPEDALDVITATAGVRWVLLGHDGPTVAQLEARLRVPTERLNGWSLDTVAAVFRHVGCAADAPTCARARALTAGLPLFVRNLGQLALDQYRGDVAACCDELERGEHLQRTAQEVLLDGTLGALGGPARQMADVLGLARVALTADESSQLAVAAGLRTTDAPRALRELAGWGVARHPRVGYVQLHDAFRLLCDGSVLGADASAAARRRLCDLLDPAGASPSVERAARYLELLPEVGDVERLIEIAANEAEALYERGLVPHVYAVIDATAADVDVPHEMRLSAHDALALWDLQEERFAVAANRLDAMERLASETAMSSRAMSAIRLKRLQLAGLRRDAAAARRAFDEIEAVSAGHDALMRVARYGLANSLFQAGEHAAAVGLTERLIEDYYKVLGLTPQEVVAKRAEEVMARLPAGALVMDDVKRLADTLDLHAFAKTALGQPYFLAKFHAFKFYTICSANQSAARIGQDVVDQLLSLGELAEARSFMERTLLPALGDLGLVEYLVPVRAQHAILLAYAGEIAEARTEMQRLLAFGPRSETRRLELRDQAHLIEEIAAGRVALGPPQLPILPVSAPVTAGARSAAGIRRPGRNEPCPCGSGVKSKRCCWR